MLMWRMGRQMQSKVQNELEDAEVKVEPRIQKTKQINKMTMTTLKEARALTPESTWHHYDTNSEA